MVQYMQAFFSENRLTEVFVSDDKPCFTTAAFIDVTEEIGVQYFISSPPFHKSSILAETYFKIMKSLLSEEKETHKIPNWYHAVQECVTCKQPTITYGINVG